MVMIWSENDRAIRRRRFCQPYYAKLHKIAVRLMLTRRYFLKSIRFSQRLLRRAISDTYHFFVKADISGHASSSGRVGFYGHARVMPRMEDIFAITLAPLEKKLL